MAKSGETDKWKAVLGETIFTSCMNDLKYNSLMKVEGLLAITLDEENVIVINVNKSVEVGKQGFKRTLDANRGNAVKMRKIMKKGTGVEVKVEQPQYDSDGDNDSFDIGSSLQVSHTSGDTSLVNASIQSFTAGAGPDQASGDQSTTDQSAVGPPQLVVNADIFQQMTGSQVIMSNQGQGNQDEVTEVVTGVGIIQADAAGEHTIQYFPLNANNAPLIQQNSRQIKVIEPASQHSGEKQPKRASKRIGKVRNIIRGPKKIHECDVEGCTYSSPIRANLLRHQRTHDPSVANKPSFSLEYKPRNQKKNLYKCSEEGCSYSSHSISNLTRHSRTHTGDYLQCSQCSFKFSSRYELNIHVNCIHNNKPLVCQLCGFKAITRRRMQNHKSREHSNDHKYECDQCEKKFHFEEDYQAHMAVHQGLKPYKCPNCFRRFDYKSKCEKHRKACMGEIAYLCEDCGSEFKTELTLQEHYRAKHLGIQFICQCGKIFHWRTGYKRHQAKCPIKKDAEADTSSNDQI